MEDKKQQLPHVGQFENASGVAITDDTSYSTLHLLNRDLSQLEFFRRVLEEARDPSQPLLERLKFLSIFSTNLDEFFMIRVSGLKERAEHKGIEATPDGLMPADQLSLIRERLLPMFEEQARCLREEILPALAEQGIAVVAYASLSRTEQAALKLFFMDSVFPLLSPQSVDQAHPFPYIPGLNLNLGLMVGPRPEHGITRSLVGGIKPRFVRIAVPALVPRLVPVAEGQTRYVYLEELIAANIGELFPRMLAGEVYPFRVTRDADFDVREDEVVDLLQTVEQSLRTRRFGSPVRLEVASDMPPEMTRFLRDSLDGLTAEDVYVTDAPLNLPDLMTLYSLDKPELKDRPLQAKNRVKLTGRETIFDIIGSRDVLLHHPYDSYSTITDFIDAAAHDPNVVAIKMCLYRTGKNSPIPQSLIKAVKNGKEVVTIVELKARFDEEHNIEWAKRLEEAGAHVVYGLIGLKTHSKVALVIRREDERLRSYVHVATGNYNPTTSRFYTDLSLLTADREIGSDASALFNFLTGFSRQKEYRRLLVAPVNLRGRMLELIRRETAHARAGKEARITAKINRLADLEVIESLYEASQAGVTVDLIVRGICTLRPGVQGLSERITVRSIVGRFLEHSRVFYFANGGAEELYIGSADWLPRNLNRRVEVVTPISDPDAKTYLKDVLLKAYLRDNVRARLLRPDGSYERVQTTPDEARWESQLYFEGVGDATKEV
ncbi:MAG TPA: polyphosphate kinase 1 [Pyrinomonadaceae bacterium]|jgi:polyphosphate kinase